MHRGLPAALAALPLAAGLALVAVPVAHAAARQPAAVTWQDTAVQASGSYQHAITGKATFLGTGSVTGITGLTTPTSWSATFGGTLTGVSINQTSGAFTLGTGASGTGLITVKAIDAYQDVAVVTFTAKASSGKLVSATAVPSTDVVELNHAFTNNSTGDVDLSVLTPPSNGSGNVFSVTNLPSPYPNPYTLTGGVLPPGNAQPGTYDHVYMHVSDAAGAVSNGGFVLKVIGHQVTPPGNYGDYVNPFGNGFDVYRQNYRAGAVIVGWTATRADPATHFIRVAEGGNWRLEATSDSGTATGLCAANPMGGWPDPAGPTGIILTPCNNGIFQQFYESGGYLFSAVNHQYVNPHGTGAQLATGPSPVPWGGSKYTWADYAHLPA